MHEITNLTNSPYDLEGMKGSIRLPAMGKAEGEFTPENLAALEAIGIFKVQKVESSSRTKEQDPLDHDGDGFRGGSLKGAESTRSKGASRRR